MKTHKLTIKGRESYITEEQASAIYHSIVSSASELISVMNDSTFSFCRCYKREISITPLSDLDKILYNVDEDIRARLLLFISSREEAKIHTTPKQIEEYLDRII